MHEAIEIIPVDTDAGAVSNDVLRSRIGDWINRLNRTDRETCLFRDYLPQDDERREWLVRLHQRLSKAQLACLNLITVLGQIDQKAAKQEEPTL